jgi:hypothetical protein
MQMNVPKLMSPQIEDPLCVSTETTGIPSRFWLVSGRGHNPDGAEEAGYAVR